MPSLDTKAATSHPGRPAGAGVAPPPGRFPRIAVTSYEPASILAAGGLVAGLVGCYAPRVASGIMLAANVAALVVARRRRLVDPRTGRRRV